MRVPVSRVFVGVWLLCLVAMDGYAQGERIVWELGPTGSKASLRGLAAVDDEVIWACGSQSTVLRSEDGGSSWVECGPDGFGDLEFRSLHAWNTQQACIASAGTPAVLLRTEDGGEHWHEVYKADSEKAFFDGMRFWDDERGIAFSDPIDGRLLIVETLDSGRTWQATPPTEAPVAREGEAGFAASNSSMIVGPNGAVWVGTGGHVSEFSRVIQRSSFGDEWGAVPCPLVSGPAEGIFSVARNAQSGRMVVVGGDYRLDQESKTTGAFSDDLGKTWRLATQPPGGYRSSVIHHPDFVEGGWVATGPAGSDFSSDGSVWEPFSDVGFHALDMGKRKIFAVGSDGRFGFLKLVDLE
ncbi:MAG: WD40/YVTN/BNR-like repeat-containing protein [Pirellulaceae bacterium]